MCKCVRVYVCVCVCVCVRALVCVFASTIKVSPDWTKQ